MLYAGTDFLFWPILVIAIVQDIFKMALLLLQSRLIYCKVTGKYL